MMRRRRVSLLSQCPSQCRAHFNAANLNARTIPKHPFRRRRGCVYKKKGLQQQLRAKGARYAQTHPDTQMHTTINNRPATAQSNSAKKKPYICPIPSRRPSDRLKIHSRINQIKLANAALIPRSLSISLPLVQRGPQR